MWRELQEQYLQSRCIFYLTGWSQWFVEFSLQLYSIFVIIRDLVTMRFYESHPFMIFHEHTNQHCTASLMHTLCIAVIKYLVVLMVMPHAWALIKQTKSKSYTRNQTEEWVIRFKNAFVLWDNDHELTVCRLGDLPTEQNLLETGVVLAWRKRRCWPVEPAFWICRWLMKKRRNLDLGCKEENMIEKTAGKPDNENLN